MKKIIHLLFFFILGIVQLVDAQGWRAVVSLDFGGGPNPIQRLSDVSITYSGASAYGWSHTNTITLEFTGEGVPEGFVHIYATGSSAWDPGNLTTVEATSGEMIYGDCNIVNLDMYSNIYTHIQGSMIVYPRLRIDYMTRECDAVTLISDICTNTPYTWEVSESNTGPFTVLPHGTHSIIRVTTENLAALGLKPYGRKFFRVTGNPGTTSEVDVADLYYPPPSASFSMKPPLCHDGQDGEIRIDIVSSHPAEINDFIVTVTRNDKGTPTHQVTLENTASFIADGLQAGYYTVTLENHSSTNTYGRCGASFDVGILPNPQKVMVSLAEVSDYNGFQIRCKDGSDGAIAIRSSGGTGLYSAYEWKPQVSSTDRAENLGEGTYTVRVRDSNDCWSNALSQTLVAPGALAVSLQSTGGKGGFDVSCLNMSDGEISATTLGGVAPYSYRWSTGSTAAKLTALATGTYGVAVSDHHGCSTSQSLTLRAPQPIGFAIDELTGISCAGERSGALQVQSVVNTIGQIFYSWSSGESTAEVNNKGAGTYTITVSDEQGCERTKAYVLEEPAALFAEIAVLSDFNGSAIRCYGESTGRLRASLRDGNNAVVPGQYYSWYKDNVLTGSGGSASILEDVTAGNYSVKIGYSGVCETQDSFILSEPDPVSPAISVKTNYSGESISCYGAADAHIEVSTTGGTGGDYTYLWTSGETDSMLTNLAAGRYEVTATDVNGCAGTTEKILVSPEPVKASITVMSNFSGQALSCADASDARIQGNATGGTGFFSYRWNTGDATRDLLDIPSGRYTFAAEDANGCLGTAQITIANPTPVDASNADLSDYSGFGVSCDDARDGFLLSHPAGGTGSYTFEWDDGASTSARYDNLGAGIYRLRISDENGCSDTHTFQLTKPSALTLTVMAIKNVSCHDGDDGAISLEALGGTGEYQFREDEGPWQPQPLLTGLKAGRALVEVRDANDCHASIPLTLTEPSPLSIRFSNIQPALCNEPRGQVSAEATGGTGSYQYLWTRDVPGDFMSDQMTIANLTAGIYTLKVTDTHLCDATESVAISSTDGPNVQTASIVSPTCSYAADGSAAVVATGEGPFTFLWENGQQNARATNLRQGNFFVTVTDENNCSVVESIVVPAPDSLRVSLIEETQPQCHGDCNGKLVVAAIGGNGNYFYDWSDKKGPEASGLCAGQYTVTVTDEKGCKAQGTFALLEPEPLRIKLLSAQAPDCPGGCDGRIAIEPSGGTGIVHRSWSTGSNALELEGLCAGSYTATLHDANQCLMEKTFLLENPPAPPLDLGGSIVLCQGQTHILDPGSYWQSYRWTSTTGFTSSAQRVTLSEEGTYWLETVSNKNCTARDTFSLQTSRDLLNANFLLTSEATTTDTVVVIDISWPLPDNTRWIFPEEMNRFSYDEDPVYGQFPVEGQYAITLLASLGSCRDQMTKTITVFGEAEPADDGGRLGQEPFVKEFTLYPNPNEGMFDVKVELLEPRPLVLTIWNTMTGKKVGQFVASGKAEYTAFFDLRPLSAGTYSLRLDYGTGTRYLRFIVR